MRRIPAEFSGIGGKKILIEEPCNYVSNVAFYHSVTRICDYPEWNISKKAIQSQKRSFSTLSMGSHFWHASHTFAGKVFDNVMMSVVAYLVIESITEKMPGDSIILKQMSETPRKKTSSEVVEGLTTMFIDQPPSEWSMTLNNIDMPTDYYMIFTAIVASVGALVLPGFVIEYTIGYLAPLVIADKENAAFFSNKWLPELLHSTSSISLSSEDSKSIQNKFEGMLIKIAYAFLW